MARGNASLSLSKKTQAAFEEREPREVRSDVRFERQRESAPQREYKPRSSEAGTQTFRIAVGHDHGVKPGNIVGAIANEANIESRYIGRIDIRGDHTLLDLPSDLSSETIEHLRGVRVAGQMLNITADGQAMPAAPRGPAAGAGRSGAAATADTAGATAVNTATATHRTAPVLLVPPLDFAALGRGNVDLRPCVLKAIARHFQLGLLKAVGGENENALAVQSTRHVVLHFCGGLKGQ